jgi:ABC-type transport system substrate-binding protein
MQQAREKSRKQPVPEGYTMEVKLRKGLKFHDGTPFTSADAKATYEYGSQPDRPAQRYPGPFKIDIVDDHTCRITPKSKTVRPCSITAFRRFCRSYRPKTLQTKPSFAHA